MNLSALVCLSILNVYFPPKLPHAYHAFLVGKTYTQMQLKNMVLVLTSYNQRKKKLINVTITPINWNSGALVLSLNLSWHTPSMWATPGNSQIWETVTKLKEQNHRKLTNKAKYDSRTLRATPGFDSGRANALNCAPADDQLETQREKRSRFRHHFVYCENNGVLKTQKGVC